jgi:hypothetical protein
MKKPLLMTLTLGAALVAATVLAAPQAPTADLAQGGAPNRAAAYMMAMAG